MNRHFGGPADRIVPAREAPLFALAAPTPEAAPPAAETLLAAGLDPTLLDALVHGNPLAIGAVAGVLDNSLLLALTGAGGAAPASPAAPAPAAAADLPAWALAEEDERAAEAQLRPADLARDAISGGRGTDERTEGSGEHGRLEPAAVDHANHLFWRGVAAGADAMGLVNAARHMNHYLDNSGSSLEIDVAHVLRDAPACAGTALEEARTAAIDDAHLVLEGADPTLGGAWDVRTPRSSVGYLERAESEDWFFAVGGNTTWLEGGCRYTPDADGSGDGTLRFEVSFHLADRYNWDGGKAAVIMGVVVNDEVLGRLHAVGLAMEYDQGGQVSVPFEVRYEGGSPGPGHVGWPELGTERGEREGRDDLGRERR